MSPAFNTNGLGTASGVRHPTRTAALVTPLQEMLGETGRDLADFAEAVATAYCDQVPEEHRQVQLTPVPPDAGADSYCRWKMRTTKAIQRFINGDIRFPSDLEDAWIVSLPEPYRRRCEANLAARRNRLSIEIPDEGATAADLGELVKQAGEEQIAAAPVFADGQITHEDLPYLPDAIRNCEESASASLAMRERLMRELRRLRSEEQAGPRLQPVGGGKH